MKSKTILLAIPILALTGLFMLFSSCGDEDPDPIVPVPLATSLSLVSGGSQAAKVESLLAGPIEVVVKDQDGKAFPGEKVNFTVTEGSVSSGTATTDANGKASVTWTLGATVGNQTLTVTAFKANGTTALSGSPLTVTATASENIVATSIELVSGGDQSAEIESALANSIIVLVKDQDGNVFPGATVNFDVAEGSVSSATGPTDDEGKASVTWTLGATAGTQALTVTAFQADGTTALTGSPITVNATATAKEPVSIELFSGGDQSAMNQTYLSEDIVFLVKDANGDPFQGAQVNLSVTEGILPSGLVVVSNADGLASTRWELGPTVGTQTLTVTAFKADGTTHLTGSPLTVTATATDLEATMLYLVDGEGQSGKANTVLLEPIRIKAWGYGNPIEGQTIYFDVTEGSVSPTSAITDATGHASATWTLGPTAGTQTLTVTSFGADGTTHLDESPLLVNATVEAGNETGTVTDYDGNVYQTIKIGEQIWMAENLKVIHFSDGTAIPNITDDLQWKNLAGTDKAYCYENNDVDSDYGIFYTRSAALNGAESSTENPSGIQGACPVGWHIPSNAEWKVLTDSRYTNVLKEPGTVHWLPPSESNNESGFTALGAGNRSGYNGTFTEFKERGYWWLTDIYTYNGKAYSAYLGHYNALDKGTTYANLFNNGHSVRCVKD